MASISQFAEVVCDDFFAWVMEFDQNFATLQEYITTWLLYGNGGIEAVGGDYSSYLLAVIAIADEYTKNPSALDYAPDDSSRRERRVDRLVDFDSDNANYLSYPLFQRVAFRELRDRAIA